MIHYWALSGLKLMLRTAVPLLAGLALCVLSWRWRQEAAEFVEHMRQVEGRIVEMKRADSGWSVQVEHLDVEGVPYNGTYSVSDNDEPTLRAAGRVNVVYDSRDPRKAELGTVVSASNEAAVAWLTLALGIGCFAFAAFSVMRVWLGIRSIERLFLSGTIVHTEVREHTVNAATGRGVFTYAFRGTNARWFEGKSPEMKAAELAEWPVGKPVVAVYDPANPKITEVDVFGVLAASGRPSAA